MTISQSQAIWELCRQGFPLAADEAADLWEHGRTYECCRELRIPRQTAALIEQCNWEIRRQPLRSSGPPRPSRSGYAR